MHLKNGYWYFKGALPKEFCNNIIELGKKNIQQDIEQGISVKGTTAGRSEKGGVNAGDINIGEKTREELDFKENEKKGFIRDSEVTWLNHPDLYKEIIPYIKTANENSGWNFQFDYHEQFQFTKYTPGGFYGWHSDGESDSFGVYRRFIPGITPLDERKKPLDTKRTLDSNMIGKVRKISATISLNDPEEYEGGNLKFDFGPHSTGDRFVECIEARTQGSVIVFPSFQYHCVTPVTKGTRYSLVLWTLGYPFK